MLLHSKPVSEPLPQDQADIQQHKMSKIRKRRCETCRFWERMGDIGLDKYARPCEKTHSWDDYIEFDQINQSSAGDSYAILFFGKDFGCIHWKPKKRNK